jgi:cell division protein ZapA
VDELSIKVNISDRIYPLTVQIAEEEKIRKAAKLINDKLKAYGSQFAVRDKQDIISMCALEIATELISLQEMSLAEGSGLAGQLNDIHELLKGVTL